MIIKYFQTTSLLLGEYTEINSLFTIFSSKSGRLIPPILMLLLLQRCFAWYKSIWANSLPPTKDLFVGGVIIIQHKPLWLTRTCKVTVSHYKRNRVSIRLRALESFIQTKGSQGDSFHCCNSPTYTIWIRVVIWMNESNLKHRLCL